VPVQRTDAEETGNLSNKQNCGHHNFLRKHGLDIISVLQKCLWLNGLNSALKSYIQSWETVFNFCNIF
jgi:hypothetical protein